MKKLADLSQECTVAILITKDTIKFGVDDLSFVLEETYHGSEDFVKVLDECITRTKTNLAILKFANNLGD